MSSSEDEVAEARRRLKEEADQVRQQLAADRKAKQRALVGKKAPEVGERRQQVRSEQQRYADMGKEHNTNKELDPNALAESDAVRLRKLKLEEDLQKVSVKGKTYLTEEEQQEALKSPGTLAKEKFEKGEGGVPTLFHSDPFAYENSGSGAGSKSSTTKPKVVTKAPADLTPKGWDGKFYSLSDIQQRRIENVDKHNREQ